MNRHSTSFVDATRADTPTAPTPRFRSRRLLLLLPALALLAAACGDDVSGASSGASGGETTIAITDPVDGATVGTEFTVTVDPSVPIGEPDTGRNHVHLYYDGNRSEDPADYDIVYTTSFTVTRLDEGEHTIEAVIANPDHSVTDVATEIAVTVSDGGPSGPSGEEPATTTTEDPSGY